MKLSTAVALRISKILKDKGMSQYRLEKDIAMPHNTMKTLMGERNRISKKFTPCRYNNGKAFYYGYYITVTIIL